MSKYSGYDIYGEPLERNYCEVHPWIPEEYPCYIGMGYVSVNIIT